ncbi:MAG TPA: hemolysin family protein [Beutenbergiaceae bacterium]|nr:hemolysin family protein [Beutenbergiaceae bacterium]
MILDWIFVGIGVVLTLGTFVFVAAEFALVALDPAVIDRLATDPDPATARKAGRVSKALRHLSTELSGAQVGITLTTVLLGYTMQAAIANLIGAAFAHTELAAAVAAVIAVTLSLIIVNAFSMLVGELIPKNWAIADPVRVAMLVSPVQRGFTALFRPLIVMLNASANAILHRFGIEPKEELSGARSAPELASLVRHSAQAGTLDVGTATLLTRSIAMNELSAVDVMTDRLRLETLRKDDTVADLLEKAYATGFSRFPLIGETSDEIAGVATLRRAIAVPYEKRGDVPAGAVMEPISSVPETMNLAPLLLELRNLGAQMAVVVDEYGGTSGIVTLEDVVEEIVGEVADEHDRLRLAVRAVGPGTWLIPGTLRPDELETYTQISVPNDASYETIGGLILNELGRLPTVGENVEFPGVTLTVERLSGRRIEQVRVRGEDSE